MNDERTGKAHALTHAARELARVGGFETIGADEVDCLQ